MRTGFGACPVRPLIDRFRPLVHPVGTPIRANRRSSRNYLIQMALSKKTRANLGAESIIRPVSRLLQGSGENAPCLSAMPVMLKAAPADEPPRGRYAPIRSEEPAPLLGARPPPQHIEPQRQRCPKPERKLRMIGDAVVGKWVD